jgi:hypothetical protein
MGARLKKCMGVALGLAVASAIGPEGCSGSSGRVWFTLDEHPATRAPANSPAHRRAITGKQTHASVDICCEAGSEATFCARELEEDWGSHTILGLRDGQEKGGIAVEPNLKAASDETPHPKSSFDSVRDGYHETIRIGGPNGAPDLTKAQLAAPLSNAAFVSGCGAPDEMKVTVRVAVRMGRAVGVTVTTHPRSAMTASCIDRAVRGLRWESSPNTDFVTTTY